MLTNGLYTAPSTSGDYNLRATSVQDPSCYAEVPIHVPGWRLKWKRDIAYLGTKEVAEFDAAGIHVTHVDHLGSPRLVTGPDGKKESAQKYMPFGETLDQFGIRKASKGFTNHEQTDDSGLIYMQARFYAPQYHRFLSPDPARDQHFEATQSWNIYSYVQNMPLMMTDPSGLVAECNLKSKGYDAMAYGWSGEAYCATGLMGLLGKMISGDPQDSDPSQSPVAALGAAQKEDQKKCLQAGSKEIKPITGTYPKLDFAEVVPGFRSGESPRDAAFWFYQKPISKAKSPTMRSNQAIQDPLQVLSQYRRSYRYWQSNLTEMGNGKYREWGLVSDCMKLFNSSYPDCTEYSDALADYLNQTVVIPGAFAKAEIADGFFMENSHFVVGIYLKDGNGKTTLLDRFDPWNSNVIMKWF